MQILLIAIVILLLCMSAAAAPTIPGTRMEVDWPKLITGQDIILNIPPADTDHGLLLGNGDIGVSVFGAPDCITLQVGKNDIWDYRDDSDTAGMAPTQQQIIDAYTGPVSERDKRIAELDALSKPFADAYGAPMHCPKPAGQIRFRNTALADASYTQRLGLWNAEVTGEFADPAIRMRTFVPYARNVIIVQYTPSGKQSFDIELARHKDTTGTIPNGPEFGAEGDRIWLRYKFPADQATYPNGFEYVMSGRVIGGEVTSEVKDGYAVAHVTSSKTVTLIVAIATTREDPDPFTKASAVMDSACRAGVDTVAREHQAHWHEFWQRSFVQLSNAYLTRHWFVSNYHLACCSKPGAIAPGLFGNWSWMDSPPWSSDYHWNYNFEQPFWGAYSSNHLEQTVPYNQTVIDLLPAAKRDARETYGMRGAKYFLTSFPRKTSRNPLANMPLDRSMCLSAWAVQEMWWHFLYSQDREYLRTQAYPVMKECAFFYEDFVTKNADGSYEICPTVSPEHWGLTANFERNRNCLIDLTLIKYLMKACTTASEVLGGDEDKRALWKEIATHLHDYPTYDGPDGRVYVDVEDAPPIRYNVTVPTTAIFPGNDIGLDSDPTTREIATRTAKSIKYNLANEYIMLAMARVRMGINELDQFEANTRFLSYPNGVVIDVFSDGDSKGGPMPWIWVENFGAPVVINESLVQSYTGAIRIAPVKLDQTVRFAQLRTEGAFLVSGEISASGEVTYVSITSEAGGVCRILRPWGGEVRVRQWPSLDECRSEVKGDTLVFTTTKGSTYVIDRADHPWEDQPKTSITAPSATPAPHEWRVIRAEGSLNEFTYADGVATMRIEGKAENSNGWQLDIRPLSTSVYTKLMAVVEGSPNARVYLDVLGAQGQSIANTKWQPAPDRETQMTIDLPAGQHAVAVAIYAMTTDGQRCENRIRSVSFTSPNKPAIAIGLSHIAHS